MIRDAVLNSILCIVTLPGCCCCQWLKPFEMRTVLVKEALDYSKAMSCNPCQDELAFDKNLDSGQCNCFERLAPVRIPENTCLIRFTPLHLACYHGFREIVKHILRCTKAPLNHCDKTPLMVSLLNSTQTHQYTHCFAFLTDNISTCYHWSCPDLHHSQLVLLDSIPIKS